MTHSNVLYLGIVKEFKRKRSSDTSFTVLVKKAARVLIPGGLMSFASVNYLTFTFFAVDHLPQYFLPFTVL